jgi:cytochrome c oxidase subunit 2
MGHARAFHSVLTPAGPAALAIERLWWLMFTTSAVVFLAVLCVFVLSITRRSRPGNQTSNKTLAKAVSASVAVTVGVIFALLVASVWTGRVAASAPAGSAVAIEIVGHQWWWEVVYEDAIPSRRLTTANELHVPLGRPVVLKVSSRDVIHSFWAPNLQGKRDLIPGYTTAIWMQADRPGIFRGQCAEFCGLQHAHMAFDVVAQPEAAFEGWLDGMRRPASEPQGEVERHGHDLFMSSGCATCHTVRGTEAHGQVAPDLTHIAIRSTLGAGTLSNTAEHLQAWVRDPQASKPGNQMPANPLPQDDIESVVAYLETLR